MIDSPGLTAWHLLAHARTDARLDELFRRPFVEGSTVDELAKVVLDLKVDAVTLDSHMEGAGIVLGTLSTSRLKAEFRLFERAPGRSF